MRTVGPPRHRGKAHAASQRGLAAPAQTGSSRVGEGGGFSKMDRRELLMGASGAWAAPAVARAQDGPGVKWVPVVGGKYKVWTQKVGSGPTQVLLLHGGPGFSHDYLEAFTPFAQKAGLEIYYYDQLGCGFSDHPQDTSLWTV